MYCSHCGKQIPDDSVFCPECGEQISGPAVAPATPAKAAVSPPPISGSVTPGLKFGIIIGTLFIPLLGIIMGAIYWRDADPEKKKAGKLWFWAGIGIGLFWFFVGCLGALTTMTTTPDGF